MIARELAAWDASRLDATLHLPVRELLLGYIELLKSRATERYEHELLVWATLAPHTKEKTRPPRAPAILRAGNRQ